jgi:chromosome partitioning protein
LEVFESAAQFDFVLFDCPPSLGVLSANALVAADHVVIPMQAEYLSLQGMAKLVEVIQLVQKRLNPQLQIACVLPCMLDGRTNLSTEVLREIDAHFGSLLTKTRIRNNVKLAEAPSFGRTIFEHAPDSNGARDYEAFATEFLAMIGAAQLAPGNAESAMAPPPPVQEPVEQQARERAPEPPPLAADASA